MFCCQSDSRMHSVAYVEHYRVFLCVFGAGGFWFACQRKASNLSAPCHLADPSVVSALLQLHIHQPSILPALYPVVLWGSEHPNSGHKV